MIEEKWFHTTFYFYLIGKKGNLASQNDSRISGKLPHKFYIVHKVYFVCHDFSFYTKNCRQNIWISTQNMSNHCQKFFFLFLFCILFEFINFLFTSFLFYISGLVKWVCFFLHESLNQPNIIVNILFIYKGIHKSDSLTF